MFPCLPARATFAADTEFVSKTQKVSGFFQKQFVLATMCHEQQCVMSNDMIRQTALRIVNIAYLFFSNRFRFSCMVRPGLEWNTSIVPASQQNKKYSRDAEIN